jgi:hypothetical protein
MPWYEIGVTKWSTIAVEADSESAAFDIASYSEDYDEMQVNAVYEDAEDISRLHQHADKIIWDMK